MDKVLAFSILSASPAHISASAGAGLGARWTRLSWRSPAAAFDREEEKDRQESSSRANDGGSSSRERARGAGEPAFLPRFAPEFDGIDCFETIVSH